MEFFLVLNCVSIITYMIVSEQNKVINLCKQNHVPVIKMNNMRLTFFLLFFSQLVNFYVIFVITAVANFISTVIYNGNELKNIV